ncbi:MAG TPA: gamma-glutamyltransferase family protein [Thermoanaerobaculia bacterium]|nr:gamma-glutamyltransferase family protein [Thermoanaerobaculia bacterium]
MPRPRLARRLGLAAGGAALALQLASAAPAPAGRPAGGSGGNGDRASAGAVASGHREATAAGLAALRDGGNAVDAAVATALALAVVYPEAGNLGGGGFAVVMVRDPQGRGAQARAGSARDDSPRGDLPALPALPALTALDFRETAPAAAGRDMYLDAGRRPVPEASTVGPLAAGTPGSPRGLYELHRALGRLAWARVVAPAIHLARDGFEVDAHLHELLAAAPQRRLLERFPESAAVWLPGGQALPAGTRLRLPALAATLARYAEMGPAAVTAGPVAAAVAAASRRHGGVLGAGDLAAYRPVWREPVRFTAFGWQLASMPLPSAGGTVLGQSCAMLERLGWGALPRGGADRAHLLAETFRRAYADRVLLGDPATSLATPAQLLDPRWIASRAAGIDRARATPSATLAPWSAAAAAAAAAGAAARDAGETTHLSTVDGEGNAVALTTTLNGLFGCGLYVPEIGFLNNEMDDFATSPRPAAAVRRPLELSQAEANAIAPRKRMLSSMTPTIAWRDRERIVLGGRGSLRIPTATAQVLLDLLVDHDGLQAAVDRPRLHHQGLPDRLEAEPGALSPETVRELQRRGHRVVTARPEDGSRVTAVRRLADGSFEAAVDPRGAAAVGGQGVIAVTAAGGRHR